jgi:serine/threonine protein kinase
MTRVGRGTQQRKKNQERFLSLVTHRRTDLHSASRAAAAVTANATSEVSESRSAAATTANAACELGTTRNGYLSISPNELVFGSFLKGIASYGNEREASAANYIMSNWKDKWGKLGSSPVPQTPEQMALSGCLFSFDNFEVVDVLGEGSYGKVYKLLLSPPGASKPVCLGNIFVGKFEKHSASSLKERFFDPLVQSGKVTDETVVDLVGFFLYKVCIPEHGEEPYFIMVMLQEAGEGSLEEEIEQTHSRRLEFIEKKDEKGLASLLFWAIDVLVQLLQATTSLKSKGVAHRDIEPGNIVRVRNGYSKLKYKLIDFGAATEHKERVSRLTTQVGTSAFWPQLRGNKHANHDVFFSALSIVDVLLGDELEFLGENKNGEVVGRKFFDPKNLRSSLRKRWVLGGKNSQSSKIVDALAGFLSELIHVDDNGNCSMEALMALKSGERLQHDCFG